MRRELITAHILCAFALSAHATPITVQFSARESLYGGPISAPTQYTESASVPDVGSLSATATLFGSPLVQSTVNARIDTSFLDTLSFEQANSARIDLNWLAGSNANLQTDYGLHFDVKATLFSSSPYTLIFGGFGLFLNDSRTTDTQLANIGLSDQDFFDVPGVCASGLGIGNVACANLFVRQESTLNFGALAGTVQARNRLTGTIQTRDFFLGDSGASLDLNLQQSGIWDLGLVNTGLQNSINTTFSVGISGTLGVLGVPVERVELPYTVPFLSIDPHSLNYRSSFYSLGTVSVADEIVLPDPSVSVPEPSTLGLLSAGLLGLGFMRRRRAA